MNELFANFITHIGNVKIIGFASYFGIKNDVQQQIAQFFFDFVQIIIQNSIAQFISFFDGQMP